MIQVNYNKILKRIEATSPVPLTDPNDIRIWNYVDTWNIQKGSSSEQLLTETFEFRIVYHSCSDLYSGNEYMFGQKAYKQDENKGSLAIPTVHLTLFNVFEDSSDLPDVKRYKKIIDSSIWNYYVPIEVRDGKFYYNRFENALKEISFNSAHKRYNLSVSHEYADLNARLLEQSHLKGGHKKISPFLFHSEDEMYKLIKDYVKEKKSGNREITLSDIQKYRWRFLLLDDKAVEKMSDSDGSRPGVDLCKLQIITDNLCRILGFEQGKVWYRIFENAGKVMTGEFKPSNALTDKEIFTPNNETPQKPEDIQIVIDCVRNVNDARNCIRDNKYDIILLDYLLENDEYGYQVLENIWNNRQDNRQDYIPGPNKRFFFMFISAFTTAVHERMLEKGFGKSEPDLWYIGNGACPTNTPFLFSYRLLLMMRHRLADIKKENEGNFLSVIDLLEEIYVKKGETGTEETRQKAHEHFNHVLFMREKYKTLEKDFEKDDESYLKEHPNDVNYILKEMKSSLLVQSAFKIVNHFSGAFFEHLQHLVYLTAFGTIRQWQDMWEEYVFVSKELCDYDFLVNEKVKENDKEILVRRGRAVSDAIREYIINLKENKH